MEQLDKTITNNNKIIKLQQIELARLNKIYEKQRQEIIILKWKRFSKELIKRNNKMNLEIAFNLINKYSTHKC